MDSLWLCWDPRWYFLKNCALLRVTQVCTMYKWRGCESIRVSKSHLVWISLFIYLVFQVSVFKSSVQYVSMYNLALFFSWMSVVLLVRSKETAMKWNWRVILVGKLDLSVFSTAWLNANPVLWLTTWLVSWIIQYMKAYDVTYIVKLVAQSLHSYSKLCLDSPFTSYLVKFSLFLHILWGAVSVWIKFYMYI